jgi:hypothetical protein
MRNQVVWLWWVINLAMFEFESGIVLFSFILSLFRLKNCVCLSRGVQVAGAAWRAATKTVTEVGDLMQMIRDDRINQVLGGRAVERSSGAVCGLHRAHRDDERMFLSWASKPRSTVCEWFGLKTTRTVFASLASKPVAMVSNGLVSKPAAAVFSSLTSKLVAIVYPDLASKPQLWFLGWASKPRWLRVSRFGPQNRSFGFMIWASKSPQQFHGLCLKTKWATVCQLHHKTDGGRSMWDTRRDLAACFAWKQVWLGFLSLAWRLSETRLRVVHVAPSWRLRRRKTDGSMRRTTSDSATLPLPFSMY